MTRICDSLVASVKKLSIPGEDGFWVFLQFLNHQRFQKSAMLNIKIQIYQISHKSIDFLARALSSRSKLQLKPFLQVSSNLPICPILTWFFNVNFHLACYMHHLELHQLKYDRFSEGREKSIRGHSIPTWTRRGGQVV